MILLEKVGITEKKLESYQGIADDALLEEVYDLGKDLRGVRIGHISSTPFGGGVPEILLAVVPLERDLGIQVDWYAIQGSDDFFTIGKSMYNALQGANIEIIGKDRDLYLQYNRDIGSGFDSTMYDIVMVHTHQLLALPDCISTRNTRWVWRCHLDTSSPSSSLWDFIKLLIEKYHAAIFTVKEFIPPDLRLPCIEVMAPAIDPLSPKNRDLPLAECKEFVSDLGVDPARPIVLHSSRLDQWQDPLGLIRCYYLAKDSIPELQLVITSSLSLDDPETFSTLRLVDVEAAKDEDIHVYTNMDGFGDVEVNAFQRVCGVGIFKSLREGFGLSVFETLWKKRPVLSSRVGGRGLQLADNLDYCLVDNIEDYAAKLVHLFEDGEYAGQLGEFGHRHVRTHFLSPRLVRDELAFIKTVLG